MIENILFLENQYGICTNYHELISKSTNIEKEAPMNRDAVTQLEMNVCILNKFINKLNLNLIVL